MSSRAVLLDRDGVLNIPTERNGLPGSPRSLGELVIYKAASESLARLVAAGYLLLAVTNQPEVARGLVSLGMVDAINAELMRRLPVREFFVCWHDDADGCDCRKPLPGLLLRAAAKYQVDLGASFMVGDRWKDIAAGQAAGCRTILIDQGWAQMAGHAPADCAVRTLTEAADWILSQR